MKTGLHRTIHSILNVCIALSWFIFLDGISLLFLGEYPYPEK